MKKFFPVFFICMMYLISFPIFCVEWPQDSYENDDFISYFGQNIAGRISTSIVFANPADVKAVKDGKLLIIMSNISDDSEFFPSTLGNTVILCHDDDLISVYANLDGESTLDSIGTKTVLKEGDIIGETGNSGWQNTRNNLEFQILDLQESTAINPKILLPRAENEIDYTMNGVMLQNKDGKLFDIRENKVFPTGSYKVYQARNKIASPYKTAITINGVLIDEISFDTIGQENGRLYIAGYKKKYNSQELYPDDTLILLGEAMLTPGRYTLGLTAQNFLGKVKQQNYVISIY